MRIFVLTLFIIASKNSFASNVFGLLSKDTTFKEYKMSKAAFLEKYGRDDSSRALIKFFYRKKMVGKIGTTITAPVTVSWAFILDALFTASHTSSAGFGLVFLGIDVFALLAVSLVFLIIFIIILARYSRKRLLQLVKNYAEGDNIPKGIARSHLYRRMLKREQNNK